MLSSIDATPPPSGARRIHPESPLEQRLHALEHENEYLRSELVQTRAELLRVTKRKQALEVAAREQRQRIGKIVGHEDALVETEDVKSKAYQQFTHKFVLDTEKYKNAMLAIQAESYEAMADALVASMNDLFSTKEAIYKAELDRLSKLNKDLEKRCIDLMDNINRMKMCHGAE